MQLEPEEQQAIRSGAGFPEFRPDMAGAIRGPTESSDRRIAGGASACQGTGARYGVPTRRLNEPFKPNRDRFPPEIAFQVNCDRIGIFDVAN